LGVEIHTQEPRMVAHSSNPSTQEAELKDLEFEAMLGYLERPCIKNKQPNPKQKYSTFLHNVTGKF
jgi:hypothetical protein